jgi:hypothetical protein
MGVVYKAEDTRLHRFEDGPSDGRQRSKKPDLSGTDCSQEETLTFILGLRCHHSQV